MFAFRLTRFFILVLATVMMSGCASTSVVSKSATSGDTYKLESAKVVWVEKISIPYSYYVKGRHGLDSDKLSALQAVIKLHAFFGQSGTTKVKEYLALNSVVDGSDVRIELSPVSANVGIGKFTLIERELIVRVTIRDAVSGQELWYVTIRSMGYMDTDDPILLDNFTSTLIIELKSAGWL